VHHPVVQQLRHRGKTLAPLASVGQIEPAPRL
jgi:hypothetical protein